jgi:hypothetical protein
LADALPTPYRVWLLLAALAVAALQAGSCRRERSSSLEELIVVQYLDAWRAGNYDRMWEQIHHSSTAEWWPSQFPKEQYREAMARLPIPIRTPQVRATRTQQDGSVVVDYSVRAPALGCISMILLRETDVRVYPYLLSEIADGAYKPFDFSATVRREAGKPAIVADSADFYIPVHLLHQGLTSSISGVLFQPGEALAASVNTLWALKHKVPAAEWVDRGAREAEACYKGRTLVRPRF